MRAVGWKSASPGVPPWILISAALLAVTIACHPFHAAPSEKPKDEGSPKPPAKDLSDFKSLTQGRRDAARKTYESTLQRYTNGVQALDGEKLYQWSRRWMEAQRDLSDKQDERVAAVGGHLDRMKKLAEMASAASRAGTGPTSEVSAAEFYRLEAELWLAQEKAK